jgi:hypothetical protein
MQSAASNSVQANLGRGSIPNLAKPKTVQAFGLNPAVGKNPAQRSTVAHSSSYKTPDFTISMSADPNAAQPN